MKEDLNMRSLDLSGKNVLLIAPIFYNYHNQIINAIKKYGAEVDFIQEKEYDFIYKSLRSIHTRLAKTYSNNKLGKRLRELKANGKIYDHILIIHGDLLTRNFMSDLKKTYSDAVFINYHWDSFKHNPNALTILDFFDRVYSFDRVDVGNFPQITYKPLFHTTVKDAKPTPNPSTDLLFIGVDYSDRYTITKQISKEALRQGFSFKNFLITSKISYQRKKLFKRAIYKNAKRNDFHFGIIPYPEFLALTNNAKAVLDINFEGQKGLTMRTIEVLALGKKLITTNPYIAYEPFYDEKMIHIIDRKAPRVDASFLISGYTTVNMDEYSLDNWVKEFFYNYAEPVKTINPDK